MNIFVYLTFFILRILSTNFPPNPVSFLPIYDRRYNAPNIFPDPIFRKNLTNRVFPASFLRQLLATTTLLIFNNCSTQSPDHNSFRCFKYG